MRIDIPFIERHMTDFQVAVDEHGSLMGAIALEVYQLNGRIHSELFADFGVSEPLRDLLWERIQSIAKSRGLAMLWTQETAPFWKRNGLSPAEAGDLAKLPDGWKNQSAPWLTMKLRDEQLLRHALDKEFVQLAERAKQAEKVKIGSISTIKYAAIGFSVIVAILGVIFCILLLRQFPNFIQRFHR